MSGDFTQRGEPAVLEKRIRAKHAVQSGADLVAELPLPYAAAGAKDFAEGGVKLLEKMGCTHICFGSECGNISLLEKAAELIDSDSFNNSLKLHIKAGKSYPVSAELAGEEYGGEQYSRRGISARPKKRRQRNAAYNLNKKYRLLFGKS